MGWGPKTWSGGSCHSPRCVLAWVALNVSVDLSFSSLVPLWNSWRWGDESEPGRGGMAIRAVVEQTVVPLATFTVPVKEATVSGVVLSERRTQRPVDYPQST
jgi:hypothetical protein